MYKYFLRQDASPPFDSVFKWVFRAVFKVFFIVVFIGALLGQKMNPLLFENMALAEGPIEYTPAEGEKPDYSKKYYPTEVSHDWFIELNPLLLLSRGIAVESELRVYEGLTLGADVLYRDAVIFEADSGAKGTLNYWGMAPKVRFYPLPTLSGVFFGFKVPVGIVRAEISSDQGSKEWSQFTVSPVAHVGYRITSFLGATLALYLGGGINFPKLSADQADFPEAAKGNGEWKDAAEQLNQVQSGFRPDFGLALGVAF